MVGLVLAIAIICLPFVEIYLGIQVAHQIGAGLTVALLLLLSLSGPLLVRHRGRGVWRRARVRARAGEVPGRELTDGAFLLASGVLLTIPGFFTAAVGIVLLLPPVRALVRRVAGGWFGRWTGVAIVPLRGYTNAAWRERPRGRPPGGDAGVPIDAGARRELPSRPGPGGTAPT